MTRRITCLFLSLRRHAHRPGVALLLGACLLGKVAYAEEFAYSVQFGIAEQYLPLLRNHLDIVRWQNNSDMNAGQLQRLYRAAPEQIRALLATEGFLDPQIRPRISEASGEWSVAFDIDPGPPVEVATLQLELRGALADGADRAAWEQRLQSHFALKPPQRFRQDDWDSAKKRTLAQLLVDSYPLARIVDSEARLDPATHKADLYVAIDSGPLVTLGDIAVEGLQRVPLQVIQRLTRIERGNRYSQSALLDFQSALQATPYFASVLVDVSPSADAPEFTPIRVKVKEAQMQRVGFGVGYNTNAGARFEVNYQHSNLAERGWILAANTSIETRRQFAEIKLAAPQTAKAYTDSVFLNSERSHIQGVDSQLNKLGVSRERDTGVIKTVQALRYRELPPSLHFTTPNPKLELESSPFFVNTKLRPWTAAPRRAGVSSFGIGGTNAHVVLEAAPPPGPVGPARPFQLLTLSAKTATALDAATSPSFTASGFRAGRMIVALVFGGTENSKTSFSPSRFQPLRIVPRMD